MKYHARQFELKLDLEHKPLNLNDLAKKVHQANIKWWKNLETGEITSRNKGELIALIHSEISECFSGELNGDTDDKLPHRKMGEVEMADVFIRLLDYAGGYNYDLNRAGELEGVSEFLSIPHLSDCIRKDLYLADLKLSGLSYLHWLTSNILELERKSKTSEIPGAIVRLLFAIVCYCYIKNYDLNGAFNEKMAYNAHRKDHTHEHRKQKGGKAF